MWPKSWCSILNRLLFLSHMVSSLHLDSTFHILASSFYLYSSDPHYSFWDQSSNPMMNLSVSNILHTYPNSSLALITSNFITEESASWAWQSGALHQLVPCAFPNLFLIFHVPIASTKSTSFCYFLCFPLSVSLLMLLPLSPILIPSYI